MYTYYIILYGISEKLTFLLWQTTLFFHMSSLPLNVTGRLTSSGRQEEGISWDVQDFPDNSSILERGRGDVRGVERTEFSL